MKGNTTTVRADATDLPEIVPDPTCDWNLQAQLAQDEERGLLWAVMGQFCIELRGPDKWPGPLPKGRWTLTDLNGHTGQKDFAIHSNYYFELTVDPPLPLDEARLYLRVYIRGKEPEEYPPTALRVDGTGSENGPTANFVSWTKDSECRTYSFHPSHEIFYSPSEDGSTVGFRGFAFTLINCNIDETKRDPDWRLLVDTGDFMDRVVGKRRKGLKRTPLRADYGDGLASWRRAQGTPFWEMYRKGRIKLAPDGKGLSYRTRAQYDADGGYLALSKLGGSGAYKWAGKYPEEDPSAPVPSNFRMRMGSILEEAVMLAVILDSTDDLAVTERGWIDFARPTSEDEKLWGLSPDGIIYDPTITVDTVTKFRREDWESGGHIIDDQANTVDGVNFSKGLLEIKVSGTNDRMMDYYRIQCIWAMMVLNVYWARLVKFHTNGVCRSYLMYRDFTKERELVGLIARTKARIGDNCTYIQSVKHVENRQWLKTMNNSARWYNDPENRSKASCVIEFDRREIKAYFAYIRNVRADVAMGWPELVDTPRPTLFPQMQQRLQTNGLVEALEKVEKTHADVLDGIRNPGMYSAEGSCCQIRQNVQSLMELMEKICSEKNN